MGKKRRERELRRLQERRLEQNKPDQSVPFWGPPTEAKFPFPILLAGFSVLSLSILMTFWVANHATNYQFDSFQILVAARKILGWDGTWINIYWFPIVAYVYSRLLLISQTFHDFLVEVQFASNFTALAVTTSLFAGVLWLKRVFSKEPLLWLLSLAMLSLNYYVLEFSYQPLTDFTGLGFSALGLWLVVKAIEKNSQMLRILAASLFGISVTTKYQLWILAIVGMIYEWMAMDRHLPLSEKLKRLAPYPVFGLLFSIAVQFTLWMAYGHLYVTNNPRTLLNTIREFAEYYKKFTLEGDPGRWRYFVFIKDSLGWPALIFLLYGWVKSWKSTGFIKLTFVWMTVYAVTLVFYQYMYRYIVPVLVPICVLITYGISSLPGVGKIRPTVVRGLAALVVLVPLLTITVELFHEKTSYLYSSPEWIRIGDHLRKVTNPQGHIFHLTGGQSWVNFITQRMPVTVYPKPNDVIRRPAVWPIEYLPYYKDGDSVLWSRNKDFEWYTARINVREFRKVEDRNGDIVFVDSENRRVVLTRRNQSWSLNQKPSKWDAWLVFVKKNDQVNFMLLPETLAYFKLDVLGSSEIVGLRRIHLEAKYHSVIIPSGPT